MLVPCSKDACNSDMCCDWFTIASTQCVNIDHHACRAMDDAEMVSEELLRPSLNHGNVSAVFKDFLNGGAITHPIKVSAP